jgi:hypothetical protein
LEDLGFAAGDLSACWLIHCLAGTSSRNIQDLQTTNKYLGLMGQKSKKPKSGPTSIVAPVVVACLEYNWKRY